MRWSKGLSLLVVVVTMAACTQTPPPGWQQGGQPLRLGPVRWVNGDLLIEVDHQGNVFVGGERMYGVDAAGRVYDAYDRPVALLDQDGYLTGTNDASRGWVGGYQAHLPGDEEPWLRLYRGGLLMRYDDDEERPFGMWVGCDDPQVMQTCTLVSHLIGLELLRRERRAASPRIGVGVGVGW